MYALEGYPGDPLKHTLFEFTYPGFRFIGEEPDPATKQLLNANMRHIMDEVRWQPKRTKKEITLSLGETTTTYVFHRLH